MPQPDPAGQVDEAGCQRDRRGGSLRQVGRPLPPDLCLQLPLLPRDGHPLRTADQGHCPPSGKSCSSCCYSAPGCDRPHSLGKPQGPACQHSRPGAPVSRRSSSSSPARTARIRRGWRGRRQQQGRCGCCRGSAACAPRVGQRRREQRGQGRGCAGGRPAVKQRAIMTAERGPMVE